MPLAKRGADQFRNLCVHFAVQGDDAAMDQPKPRLEKSLESLVGRDDTPRSVQKSRCASEGAEARHGCLARGQPDPQRQLSGDLQMRQQALHGRHFVARIGLGSAPALKIDEDVPSLKIGERRTDKPLESSPQQEILVELVAPDLVRRQKIVVRMQSHRSCRIPPHDDGAAQRACVSGRPSFTYEVVDQLSEAIGTRYGRIIGEGDQRRPRAARRSRQHVERARP